MVNFGKHRIVTYKVMVVKNVHTVLFQKNLTHIILQKRLKKFIGDKYDYSKVAYIDANTKVCIICKEHGEFWQKPSNHLKGHKCIFCNPKKKKDNEFVIEKFIKIHR